MVRGLDGFREWFRSYEEQYAIIGGTACDLLMTEEVDLKQLGIRGKAKDTIQNQLRSIFV